MASRLSYLPGLFVWCILLEIDFIWAADSNIPKIGAQPIWNATQTDKLRQDLLLGYDKFARPSHHKNTTTIQIAFTIKHIELDEFKSTLTAHMWIRLFWYDEKLKWKPNNYDGISTLTVADHEIWQPDIFLYNSATASPINHYGSTHCVVYEDGQVVWMPPVQVSALCNINLRYWPFDTQKCQLSFGSWTYNGYQIDLQVFKNYSSANESLLVENSEWALVNTSLERSEIYFSCCPEPYPHIVVDITLARRSAAYRAILITPAIAIILLTLLTFWLPPNAGEKIILNASNVIITCLFLLYFSQKIPAIGAHIPLIILFYSSCLIVLSISTIGAVIVIWISRTKHTKVLPWAIKQPLTGTFGKILGLSNYIRQTSFVMSHKVTAEEMRDNQITDIEDTTLSDDHQFVQRSKKFPIGQDWILFAAAIDRISFIIYSVTFAILAIIYSV